MIRPLRTVRAYRRFRRYREVLFTLARYGFGDLVDRVVPEGGLWRRFRKESRASEIPTPARLRMAFGDLGPTFVKFGQLLSTRPDILPENYLEELEKLQDEVPPFDFSEVQKIVREQLGGEPLEIFFEFESEPIASGSIAQVHRAVLHTGETVAVKIQRPRISQQIETDLEILEELTALVERHVPEMRWFRPRDLIAQFATTIRREMDFIAEGQAAERFRRNFEADSDYLIPRVFWDYTTTRILTSEIIRGVKITDKAALDARGFDRKIIAQNGARAILREVFEHRFFHADPHPGNFFVLEGNVIATVDFGIVGRLDEETADQLGTMFSAVLRKDISQLLRTSRAMGLLGEEVDEALLKADLSEFIENYHGLSLGKIDAERVMRDTLQLLRRHRVLLPVNLALVGRMMTHAAGVGRMLDPSFNLFEEARPFVVKFMAGRMDPRKRLNALMATLQDYGAVLQELPGDLEEIVAKIKRGKMLVSLHHEGLNRFILEMDRSSNRLAFSLIIASLIVGSSLVMQLESGPQIYGLPALGMGGYIIAGLLGLWLVVAILRSGRI
ncbi:MAG: AarF/ABC1/UbiB kinase family protein [Acidobacteriota bacterium]|nr:MAG: AarF/ABC1/UbiB kinase family protein [Acidobacteriota bacterium]